ncbi:unnamed protein product [Moneuplotes crassus]|uniref:PSP proline-rich domain-containing protein n=1 Tax=Euplotes crassus TaxID=5936 RepID=A0AAD1UBI3_EUPCR|nr:unnamed protein product [Moneuplotes crassus]
MAKENNKMRKKRNRKRNRKEKESKIDFDKLIKPVETETKTSDGMEVKIEYVNEFDESSIQGNHQIEFKQIFERFKTDAEMEESDAKKENDKKKNGKADDGGKDEEVKLSKRKQKELNRMKVSELKQKVKRPDVVESWDVTAENPLFLTFLKCVRNSVPVPKHWCQKRKFLQYKRGLHKTPFVLPEYIADTGISQVREASGDANKSLRQRMKERMQPKTGKLDIDYQVLHDAFFKHQTKPRLTVHGDVYYEGKEYEVKMRVYKPGRISADLCHALGIPEASPPSWLTNMQRFGPPPAYPSLKIPGVNAPIPDSMHFGNGKYIQDERGFTVYADCHGLNKVSTGEGAKPVNIYEQRKEQRKLWGEIKEESEEEYSEDADDQMEEDQDRESVGEYIESDDQEELQPGMKSGIESIINNQQFEGVDIRKKELQKKADEYLNKGEDITEEVEEVKPLYKVLKEVETGIGEGQIMGTGHTYDYGDGAKASEPKVDDESKPEVKEEAPKKKKDKKEKIKYKF